jgi:hypothetical protein
MVVHNGSLKRQRRVSEGADRAIEMKDSNEPRTWCCINKDTKQRTFYAVHDPRDIEPRKASA